MGKLAKMLAGDISYAESHQSHEAYIEKVPLNLVDFAMAIYNETHRQFSAKIRDDKNKQELLDDASE